MAHINLLPWRAERRKQREREFYGQLGVAAVVGIVAVLLWAFWMGQRIDNQHQRNAYLQGQIKQLDAKIAKIKDLEKVRSQLLARKQIIEQLQSNRAQMVHLFDELVETIPNSVRLTALNQTGQQMKLDGVAQSNASVAEYMRNLEASPWLGRAELRKTTNHHDGTRTPYSFGLNLQLSKPTDAERAAAEAAAAPATAGSTAAPAAPAGKPSATASAATGDAATTPASAAAAGGATP